jgi:hypothetical protein
MFGMWMDEYGGSGGMVLGEKHYIVWVEDGWMGVEQWWNDTDRGKLKYWEKIVIQCGW